MYYVWKTAGVKNVRSRKGRTETQTNSSVSMNWFAFWFYRKMTWCLQPKSVSIRKQPLSNAVTFEHFNSIYFRVPTEKAKVLTRGPDVTCTCCWLWGHTGSPRAGGQSAEGDIWHLESFGCQHIQARTGPDSLQWLTACSEWRPVWMRPAWAGTP